MNGGFKMRLEELLDMPFKEVLENFGVLYSPECDYIYGITTKEATEKLFEKYDLCEQESMDCEPLLRFDVLCEFEENGEVLTFERIEEIIENNLDIPLKKQSNEMENE